MSRRRKKAKKKKFLIVITIIIVLVLAAFLAYKFLNTKTVKENKKLDDIADYPYSSYSNSTKLYREHFDELKKVLSKEELDEEKYAELLAKLFVADFYDLDSKATGGDVGGLEFIHSSIVENLKLKALDTIYNGIESNVYGERKQSLPSLSKFEHSEVKQVNYDKNNIRDLEAYQVDLRWTYKKDLAYQNSASITIVHEENLLSIIDIK